MYNKEHWLYLSKVAMRIKVTLIFKKTSFNKATFIFNNCFHMWSKSSTWLEWRSSCSFWTLLWILHFFYYGRAHWFLSQQNPVYLICTGLRSVELGEQMLIVMWSWTFLVIHSCFIRAMYDSTEFCINMYVLSLHT